jgi:hypothetical protein
MPAIAAARFQPHETDDRGSENESHEREKAERNNQGESRNIGRSHGTLTGIPPK